MKARMVRRDVLTRPHPVRMDGGVALGDSKDPEREPLRYTTSEMRAFIRATRAGEFDHLLDD